MTAADLIEQEWYSAPRPKTLPPRLPAEVRPALAELVKLMADGCRDLEER